MSTTTTMTTTTTTTTPRLNLAKAEPAYYQGLAAVEKIVSESLERAGVAKGFAHLLRLRASQINGCSFCVRLHTRDALAAGESPDRAALIGAWRESQYFTDEERAALDLLESITLIAARPLEDEHLERARTALGDAKLAAVEALAILIGAWNRLAIASGFPVKP